LFEETCVESGKDSFLSLGEFLARIFLDEVKSDSAQGGEVVSGILGPRAALIFSEGNIQCPMQGVLDAPMPTDGFGEGLLAPKDRLER